MTTPIGTPAPAHQPRYDRHHVRHTGSSTGGATGLLTSAGIGSKLDVNAIVTALVNAKQAGPQAQITNRSTQTSATLAGLASLQSGLSSLQSALSALTQTGTFSSFNATLADATLGTTSTMSNAQAGNYTLDVTQLATAQKRSSTAYDNTAAIGSGTLSIGVGANSFNLNVSATDTLSNIAANINSASGNPGVTATVVYGAGGAQLLLSSSKTGVANGFTISASSDSSAGLGALASQLGTAGSNEAQDAKLSLDGIAISSASNSVSGAIDGVTINLAKTGSTQLTVSQDNSAATKAVQNFVSAYNSYVGTVGTLSSYDASLGHRGCPARRQHADLGAAADRRRARQSRCRQQHRFAGRAGRHSPAGRHAWRWTAPGWLPRSAATRAR